MIIPDRSTASLLQTQVEFPQVKFNEEPALCEQERLSATIRGQRMTRMQTSAFPGREIFWIPKKGEEAESW